MFADDNFKLDENGRKLSKWVENTVGKGEIARYEQFLLFPQCFQKACFPEASKGVIVWEWVNPSHPSDMLIGISSNLLLPWYICINPLPDDKILRLVQIKMYCRRYFEAHLTHFHTMTPFDAPGKQAFLKNWKKKDKLLVMSNFSFSHRVLYQFE